jgi:hypothetical protein
MRVADLFAYPLRRLADDLNPVKHRVLQQLVGIKARPVMLHIALDPVNRGLDIRQTRSSSFLTRQRPQQGHGPGSAPSALAGLPHPRDARRSPRPPARNHSGRQRCIWPWHYQEAYVTGIDRVTAGNRTEHTHLAQATARRRRRRRREDLTPNRVERVKIWSLLVLWLC